MIAQLKIQLNQRADTIIEIKREHTDLQIDNRRLVSELGERDKEAKTLREDCEKMAQENQSYRQKFDEQETELDDLKQAHAHIEAEFKLARTEMESKDQLITQLKEQIIDLAKAKSAHDEESEK